MLNLFLFFLGMLSGVAIFVFTMRQGNQISVKPLGLSTGDIKRIFYALKEIQPLISSTHPASLQIESILNSIDESAIGFMLHENDVEKNLYIWQEN